MTFYLGCLRVDTVDIAGQISGNRVLGGSSSLLCHTSVRHRPGTRALCLRAAGVAEESARLVFVVVVVGYV